MEEILASIRRIIADDDASKTAKPPEAPPPKPAPPPAAAAPVRPVAPPQPAPPPRPAAPPPAANNQSEIDAMLADLEVPAKPAAPKPAPKPAAPPADVLDLTEAMAAPPPPPPTPTPGPAPTFRTIDGAADVIFTDRPPDSEPATVRALEEARRTFAQPTTAERSLLSSTASAAVDSAFNTLAQTMLVNNARTIEDLVKDMLRPMLKAWLDDNLPGLVERIVRAEIERVSRGRP
jgi:cell pole-organizing protein PopZ